MKPMPWTIDNISSRSAILVLEICRWQGSQDINQGTFNHHQLIFGQEITTCYRAVLHDQFIISPRPFFISSRSSCSSGSNNSIHRISPPLLASNAHIRIQRSLVQPSRTPKKNKPCCRRRLWMRRRRRSWIECDSQYRVMCVCESLRQAWDEFFSPWRELTSFNIIYLDSVIWEGEQEGGGVHWVES